MDEEGEIERGEVGRGGAEIGFGDVVELIDARGREEAFEAGCAVAGEGGEFGCVAGDDAGPEGDIDGAGVVRSAGFFDECRGSGGGGDAVERHIDEGGDSASRGGCGGGFEAFPIGAAGVVDVDVGIDEAGHDDGVGGVEGARGAEEVGAGGFDGFDAAGADGDRGGGDAGFEEDAAAADDEVGGGGGHGEQGMAGGGGLRGELNRSAGRVMGERIRGERPR